MVVMVQFSREANVTWCAWQDYDTPQVVVHGVAEDFWLCLVFHLQLYRKFCWDVATGHECWRKWQDQERQHQGRNIQCFLHRVHVVLICLPGGLRARKASCPQVFKCIYCKWYLNLNTKNALRFVLLFECTCSIWSHINSSEDWCFDPRGSRSPTAHGSEVPNSCNWCTQQTYVRNSLMWL